MNSHTTRLYKSISENTYLFIGVLVVLNLTVLRIPFIKLLDNYFPYDKARDIGKLLNSIISVFLNFWLIKKFQLEKLAGLNQWSIRNPILLIIPFIYPMSLAIPNFQSVDLSYISWISIALILLMCVMRGLAEELAIRGLLQPYLLRKYIYKYSITRIVFLSSLVFALMHLPNIAHNNYVDTINQVIMAFFIGVFFGALMIRTGNVIMLGIIHGLINFVFRIDKLGVKESNYVGESVGTFSEIIKAVFVYSLVGFPMFIVGILILRNINKRVVMEKIEIGK